MIRRAVALAVAAGSIAAGCIAAAPAAAAPNIPVIAPFGHPCVPQDGVLFCPTQNDSQRVKTFDGVPIDVDVTAPLGGFRPPLPTIVMLHGFPGSKESFESSTPESGSPITYHYNNNFFAKQGYLVVNYSARGFGRSCGQPDSRTHPGCDRGWFHLADQRWEMHDAQALVTKLVDEGYADPRRIGVTGISYGGGSSLQLAYLKDRIRERNGSFVEWRSSSGQPIRIAAAYDRWGWSDLLYSLVPNGRFLDPDLPSPSDSLEPLGVGKRAVVDALYLGGTLVGYLAPRGSDPTADLGTWHDKLEQGEPPAPGLPAVARQFVEFKSAAGLSGTPAPVLVQDGWTDAAFSAEAAIRAYNRIRALGDDGYVSVQLGDLGHFRAGNTLPMYQDFATDGAAFFAHFLKGARGAPPNGSVKVYGQGCPKGTVGPGPIELASYDALARGSLAQSVGPRTLHGGDDRSGQFFNPETNSDPCSTTSATTPKGAIVLTRRSPGFTLAGRTTVTTRIAESMRTYGQIDAALFDVFGGQKRLIDYGAYRLQPGQEGDVVFKLAGNVYRFARGHVVRLELLTSMEPWFISDKPFSVRLSSTAIRIPTRERPNAALGVVEPFAP